MKRAVALVLEENEAVELARILLDNDAEAALAFMKAHLKDKVRELLEGG